MADALASGASVRKDVGVQVPPRPRKPTRVDVQGWVHRMSAEAGADSVTVVITAYNAARFIDVALQGVHWQSYPVSEVVVVDDASVDDTPDIVSRWADRLPIKCVKNATNLGVGASRNVGLSQVTSGLVAMLDADDLWLPEHLETLINLVQPRTVVSPRAMVWRSGNGLTFHKEYSLDPPPRKEQFRRLCEVNYVFSGSLFPFSMIDEIGLYPPERVAEDLIFWLKAISAGYEIVKPSAATVLYRRHVGSLSEINSQLFGSVREVVDRYVDEFPPAERTQLEKLSRHLGMRQHLSMFDESSDQRLKRTKDHLVPVLSSAPLRLKLSAAARLVSYQRTRNHQRIR